MVPVNGGRVLLVRKNGQFVFTGYLSEAPTFDYLGWGERGPMYRYSLVASEDETILNRKRIPSRPPFVDRGAGDALRQLTQDLLPGVFDTSAIQQVDTIASYEPDPQKKWSEQAAKIALLARASYRAAGGALTFAPIGAAVIPLNETDTDFSPEGLTLQPVNALTNDVTVIGLIEPQAYVKDYFVGDGLTRKFYLSQTPFRRRNQTLVDEEFLGATLDATRWTVTDPVSVVSVSAGKLVVAGGSGTDGQTTVVFGEKIELGGALVLQHGNVAFNGASDGVLGGLYPAGVSISSCLAGFRITPNGTQSNIQAIVNGTPTGPVTGTSAAHLYGFTTRLYAAEIYRSQQTFHSNGHPAGSGFGGSSVPANVRVVMELQDIDPANPSSLVAPPVVLYDGVVLSAPGFCAYALVNASSLKCGIAFTRMIQAVDAEVRSALPGQNYRTRLVGALSEGGECDILSNAALEFFSQYVPASNELLEVRYRGNRRALARVTNPASIAAQQRGGDDGVRGAVRHVQAPAPRTTSDCENAALAVLDDSAGTSWTGQYSIWSDLLPGGAADIFPGDALQVSAATRGANFQAIVREVSVQVQDLEGEHSIYQIRFADDAAVPLGFAFQSGEVALPLDIMAMTSGQVGMLFLADLTSAEITQATSTTVSVDSGIPPSAGGGIEVRWSDEGWGPDNDRNLVGRFSTQAFVLPRLTKVQNYFLRQYDSLAPRRYSRYTAALHLDYPL